MKQLTVAQAAEILKLHISRVEQLCRTGRLGYTVPRFGKSWVITEDEITQYLASGPRKAGRPRK